MKRERRDFLKMGGSGLAAAIGSLLAPVGGFGADRPNVIFLCIDDLNDWVGCLGGHSDARTPNIDRLAQQGILFTNAHCAAPVCMASRAAVMTGVRPSTSGVYDNDNPWEFSPVLGNTRTLSGTFLDNGYYTAGGGKIFHGYHDPASWCEYWPSHDKTWPDSPKPDGLPLNGIPGTGKFDWGPLDHSVADMGDWQTAQWAAARLQEGFDKPFFLGCGFIRPHLPWYVPRHYFERFPEDDLLLPDVPEDDLDDVPDIAYSWAAPNSYHRKVTEARVWRQAVQAYLASIAFVDDCVGLVLDSLDRSPYWESTVVVLWSDHGWHLGEKLHWKKNTLWERATRNILTFRVPGSTVSGRECSRPVSLLDIYPTLVDVCRLQGPCGQLEGGSLAGLLEQPDTPKPTPVLTTRGKGNHSLRSEVWRYTRYHDGTEELYDHTVDPGERENLVESGNYQSVIDSLKGYLPRFDAPDPFVYPDQARDRTFWVAVTGSPAFSSPDIRLSLLYGGLVQAAIYSPTGSKVADLCRRVLGPGEHRLLWNGRDNSGNRMTSGLFYLKTGIHGKERINEILLFSEH